MRLQAICLKWFSLPKSHKQNKSQETFEMSSVMDGERDGVGAVGDVCSV